MGIFVKETEDAKQAKNNFLAALTHEIRNPLNSVLGSLEIIESQVQGLSKNQIELIKNAQDSGEILQGMISNILDAAKIEAGKFDLHED